jgi:hypothetical protein
MVLLGGTDPIDAAESGDVKSCLLFHVNRESLTPNGESALRDKGIVVVPHLLLCSIEALAADSLADPEVSRRLAAADPDEGQAAADLRSDWRQKLLASWERVLARTKEEQCTAHEAAVRIAAEGLVQTSRGRLTPPPEPNSHQEDTADPITA